MKIRPILASHVSAVGIGHGSASYRHARPGLMDAPPLERAGPDTCIANLGKDPA